MPLIYGISYQLNDNQKLRLAHGPYLLWSPFLLRKFQAPFLRRLCDCTDIVGDRENDGSGLSGDNVPDFGRCKP